jgi:hypothetical protein
MEAANDGVRPVDARHFLSLFDSIDDAAMAARGQNDEALAFDQINVVCPIQPVVKASAGLAFVPQLQPAWLLYRGAHPETSNCRTKTLFIEGKKSPAAGTKIAFPSIKSMPALSSFARLAVDSLPRKGPL